MKTCRYISFVTVLLILNIAGMAKGVKVVTQTEYTEGNKKETMTMTFDSNNFRMESKGDNGHMIVLFRSGENKMVVCDMDEGTIMEMGEAELEKMRDVSAQAQQMMNSPEMQEAMRKAQESLKDLPEDQRAMAEKYLPKFDNATASASAKMTYEKSGSETVNSWSCTKYTGFMNGQKSEEVWATDISNLGFSESDFAIFKKMGKFFENLGPKMGDNIAPKLDFTADDDRGYQGVPVKNNDYEGGKLVSTSKMLEAGYASLSAADFKNPEGLKPYRPFDQMPGKMR